MDEQLNAVTIRNHLLKVAERTEAELEPEQVSFIEAWAGLPIPNGGFVRDERDKGWFEVIAGKVPWSSGAMTPARTGRVSSQRRP